MNAKYIFITGGVVSSLGKGLTSASIAMLLESRGRKIAMLKLDPYLNVDPGTMNPFQHGEVYVTDDGAETDLDLGHYYRYTNAQITKASNATSGQIYDAVIKKERKGEYLGKTVQVIPHVTDEIKQRILQCTTDNVDVTIVEIGGTVGDIESQPFLEAIRQFRNERRGSCINIHLTYVPYLKASGEVKTKPSQHSVQILRSIGIIPDLIICRSENPLPEEIKEKISLFCSVPKEYVIEEPDVQHSIYEVPLCLQKEGLDEKIAHLLKIPAQESNLQKWQEILHTLKKPKPKITVGIVGKYISHQDAYKSVFEALNHGAIEAEVDLEILGIDSEQVSSIKDIPKCDGYLVPGGFGSRGWEGKILTAKMCRENKLPYFGICLGMHVMVVEFARHVLNLSNADSTEMTSTSHPVISLLSEQESVQEAGGTMRLGAYPCKLLEKSKVYQIYGSPLISERHRHRFEFNNTFRRIFEENGLQISGVFEQQNLCEIVEMKDHPWMIGVQFHPEFKSKPTNPHPLFTDFIASIKKMKTGAQI
ncbi:MAG: CTP synthase [Simkaniaceae bacterium]